MRRALVILALLLVVSGLSAWNALLGPLHWGDTKDQVRVALWPNIGKDNGYTLYYMNAFGVAGMLVSYEFVDDRLDHITATVDLASVMSVMKLFDRSYVYPQNLSLLTEQKPDRVVDGDGRVADFWSFDDQVEVWMDTVNEDVCFRVFLVGSRSRVP